MPPGERSIITQDFKETLRKELEPFKYANPRVGDVDISGNNQSPYTLVLKGEDLKELDDFSLKVLARLRQRVEELSEDSGLFIGDEGNDVAPGSM